MKLTIETHEEYKEWRKVKLNGFHCWNIYDVHGKIGICSLFYIPKDSQSDFGSRYQDFESVEDVKKWVELAFKLGELPNQSSAVEYAIQHESKYG
jgi:hypothetical protein